MTFSECPSQWAAENGSTLGADQTRFQLATLALAGVQEQFNCLDFDADGWLGLWEAWFDPGELDHRGVHISQRVDHSGYTQSGQILTPEEGEEGSYTRTVTISLNE